jgi:hypothetical protein
LAKRRSGIELGQGRTHLRAARGREARRHRNGLGIDRHQLDLIFWTQVGKQGVQGGQSARAITAGLAGRRIDEDHHLIALRWIGLHRRQQAQGEICLPVPVVRSQPSASGLRGGRGDCRR